jgi:hypothetical protein
VRSSPAGHAKCWLKRNHPPLDPQHPPRAPAIYNWYELRRQDLAVRALVANDTRWSNHAFYMDVTPATAARPDSHKTNKHDCLHYCVPGPIDMWADLFANMVLLADTLHLLPPPDCR